MSVKVGEIWDTEPGSGLCVSPRRSGPPRRYGPQTGVSLDLLTTNQNRERPSSHQKDISARQRRTRICLFVQPLGCVPVALGFAWLVCYRKPLTLFSCCFLRFPSRNPSWRSFTPCQLNATVGEVSVFLGCYFPIAVLASRVKVFGVLFLHKIYYQCAFETHHLTSVAHNTSVVLYRCVKQSFR